MPPAPHTSILARPLQYGVYETSPSLLPSALHTPVYHCKQYVHGTWSIVYIYSLLISHQYMFVCCKVITYHLLILLQALTSSKWFNHYGDNAINAMKKSEDDDDGLRWDENIPWRWWVMIRWKCQMVMGDDEMKMPDDDDCSWWEDDGWRWGENARWGWCLVILKLL